MSAVVRGPGLPVGGHWLGEVTNTGTYSGRQFTPPQTGTYTVTLYSRSFPENDLRTGQGSASRTFTVTAGASSISASNTTPNFGSHPFGYAERPTQTITITNTGNQNVTLNALPNISNWTLTPGNNWATAMAPGVTRSFTIRPNNGLAVGNHDRTFNITGSGGASVQISPTFTVTAALQASFASWEATDTSIRLTWRSVSGAASYTVRCGDTVITFPANTLSHEFRNLSPNTTYFCQVIANPPGSPLAYEFETYEEWDGLVALEFKSNNGFDLIDPHNNGDLGAEVWINTAHGPPSANTFSAWATTTSMSINWQSVGADRYEVIIWNVDNQFDSNARIVTGSSVTFTGLTPGVRYSYFIRALRDSATGTARSRDSDTRTLSTWVYMFDDPNHVRISSYFAENRGGTLHNGIDIICRTGAGEIRMAPIRNASEGTVLMSEWRNSGGWTVNVRSDSVDPNTRNNYQVRYLHLIRRPYINGGNRVSAGAIIGYVGNTGDTSQGYHLHFDIMHRGHLFPDSHSTVQSMNTINPIPFFPSVAFE